MSKEFAWLYRSCGDSDDTSRFFSLAKELSEAGKLRVAATAYDRAYGLDPTNKEIASARQNVLNQLAIVEHGITFRYIPAGSFLMGSEYGEPDEQPIHPVEVSGFWLSETPISWAAYCDLMGWQPPPEACPEEPEISGADEDEDEDKDDLYGFFLHQENKIRLQYCEDATTRAVDWHAHRPEDEWVTGTGERVSSSVLFGQPPREDGRRPWRYDQKPMVSVSWQEAEELCQRLSNAKVLYRLPTEAEWEKAARGGLINCQYPWGNEPPSATNCDFNRFDQFSILPMRSLRPNDYGLYAMSGGVWEWTSDGYDAHFYRQSERVDPQAPAVSQEKVLRGGSWADCAEVVTVSFRMSRQASSWREDKEEWPEHWTPNIGFRLCRVERKPNLGQLE